MLPGKIKYTFLNVSMAGYLQISYRIRYYHPCIWQGKKQSAGYDNQHIIGDISSKVILQPSATDITSRVIYMDKLYQKLFWA